MFHNFLMKFGNSDRSDCHEMLSWPTTEGWTAVGCLCPVNLLDNIGIKPD